MKKHRHLAVTTNQENRIQQRPQSTEIFSSQSVIDPMLARPQTWYAGEKTVMQDMKPPPTQNILETEFFNQPILKPPTALSEVCSLSCFLSYHQNFN